MLDFRSIWVTLAFFLLLYALQGQNRILFIRGGSGTGGFLEGGADEQLSDIRDLSQESGNHGWGEFAQLLRDEGYTLVQEVEGPIQNNLPVDLLSVDLSFYELIIFGSNNAEYSVEAVDKVEAYIKGGGAALFISDANWGRNWGNAPSSDQPFLSRFGWRMNQDQGTYAINAEDFRLSAHPIFEGVSSFDGEGVSPITQLDLDIPGVLTTILAGAKNQVRLNTGEDQGPSRPVDINDAALIIADVELGRIAGHFDRNTFFNLNGAGTDINRLDNRTYALNLINWLTGGVTTSSKEPPGAGGWKVFPNPGKGGVIHLEGSGQLEQVELYNWKGQLLRRWRTPGNQIELGELDAGQYVLVINGQYSLSLLR